MLDEDPKSLLVLCDDTIRELLSFLPLKSRVRLSGTCTAVYKVVDESLLSVHSLSDEMGEWEQDEYMHSRLKTLSKMKNVWRMDVNSANMSFGDDLVEVMVENCHSVEHINGLNIKFVDAYVSGLHAEGLPVKLRTFEFCYPRRRPPPEHEIVEHLTSIMEKSKAKISITEKRMTFVGHAVATGRVVSLRSQNLDSMEIPENMLTNVRKMTDARIRSEEDMRLVLNCVPRLTHIGILFSDADALGQLIDWKNAWNGIEISVWKTFLSKSQLNVVCEKIDLLLQRKGHNVRHLMIKIILKSPDPGLQLRLIQTISRSCPRLKSCEVVIEQLIERNYVDCQGFKYERRRLTIVSADLEQGLESLSPLLNLFPRVKKFLFPNWLSERLPPPDSWMTELREFAAGKNKYCINVVMPGFPAGRLSFQQNLQLWGKRLKRRDLKGSA